MIDDLLKTDLMFRATAARAAFDVSNDETAIHIVDENGMTV